MATTAVFTYRCRMCGSLFTRGGSCGEALRSDEVLAQAMQAPAMLVAIHNCHPSAPFIAAIGDLAGARITSNKPPRPAEEPPQ
jgi:hypothetical protein